MTPSKRQINLTPVEKALLLLAEHIERCPYNDYRILEEVDNLLGIERIQVRPKTQKVKK